MYRNLAQKWVVFAFDETTGIEAAGQTVTTITAKISVDGAAGSSTTDVNPTALEGGYYYFNIDADETDGHQLTIIPVSSVTNIQVVGAPGTVFTFEHVICGISDGTGTTATIVTSLETTHGLTTDNALNGRVVIFDQGTSTTALEQQAGTITAYNGTTGLITVEAGSFTTAPLTGDTFKIY